MKRSEQAVASTLDFRPWPDTEIPPVGSKRGLRLALPSGRLRGPDKYQMLELRRRRAQIRARRVLGSG